MPSRQAMWQKKKQREGLCVICGRPRQHYRWRCDACARKERTRHRKAVEATPAKRRSAKRPARKKAGARRAAGR